QSGPNQEQAVFLHFAKTKWSRPWGETLAPSPRANGSAPDSSHTYEAISPDTAVALCHTVPSGFVDLDQQSQKVL
ncbi:hypothetical protein, partial [Pseudomonas sp. RIT409]|uniref:hypothetical protein n=1 Tax=Pseudomonas sp. RIT409 TaxID=2202159 RepID=UPI001C499540